mgnify:CR=1 FL=1
MVSVSEVFKALQEGFTNKDSSRLAELLTDDFEMVRPAGGTRTRQETLDWTAGGGNPTSIDDLEVLYENDEVAVLYHSANRPNVVMALYTKRGDKFSHCRTVRQEN